MNGKDVYPYANAYFLQIASMIGNDIILDSLQSIPPKIPYISLYNGNASDSNQAHLDNLVFHYKAYAS